MSTEVVGQKETCNPAAASAIIPNAKLLEMVFQELVAARRSTLRALEQLDRALDAIKDEKLKQ